VAVDRKSRKIICAHTTAQGRVHDRKLLSQSGVRLKKDSKAGVDSGYQGLQKEHANTAMPVKKPKGKLLTKEQKRANREQSRERIPVENVIGSLKRFRILSDRYRCRRKRFGLRLNLIAGLYNWEIDNSGPVLVNDAQG
jgi:hypothetical protein